MNVKVEMDIQAMVGRNGQLQTTACNRLKLVIYKHAKVHDSGTTKSWKLKCCAAV